jgi:hypothetical protein
MHSNNSSRRYVGVLMNQDVSPSFSEIREVVMTYPGGQHWLLFWKRPITEGLLLALLSLSLLTRPVSVSTTPALAERSATSVATNHTSILHSLAGATSMRNKSAFSSAASNIISSSVPDPTHIQISQIEPIIREDVVAPILKGNSQVENQIAGVQTANRTALSVFATGGYNALSASSAAQMQRLSGSIGVEYALTPSSSIFVEARRSSFSVRNTARTSTVRDTTMNVGGTSYLNSIGSFSNQTTNSTDAILSIGAGYQFNYQPFELWSPFAATTIGTNGTGLLSSLSLGAWYHVTDSYLALLSIRSDQYVSKQIAPQRSVAIEAGIQFAW